jgi:hypothetical protein
MYHFFAKNEELKSKKESKTSILEAQLVLVGAPSSASWGPIYTYLYMSSILSKSPFMSMPQSWSHYIPTALILLTT